VTQIKICGITSLEDAYAAIEAGTDMLGFNFYPASPRSILLEDCARITTILRQEFPLVTLVGVFVNMPVEHARLILEKCSLNLAQLHGDETPAILAAFHGNAYKAFRGVPKNIFLDEFISHAPMTIPALLLDASIKGFYGGSGLTADWSGASELAKKFAILLAGGLKPGNVADAVGQVHPWGVDTASGVEKSPGKKDLQKMRAFVQEVRSVAQ